MRIVIRILKSDPRDFSLLLLVSIGGMDRCVCRLDGDNGHNMADIGLPRIGGSHMHWMIEKYQRMCGEDDAWAEPVDVRTFEEAMRLFVACLNINVME